MTIADLWRNFTDSADIVSFFTFLVLCSYLFALEWSCAIAPSLWWSHIERKNSSRETVLLISIYNSCFVLLGKSLVLSFCCSVHTLLQKKISARHLGCHCAWENAKMFAVFCLFPSFLRKFPSFFVIFWVKVPGILDARIHLFSRPVYIQYKSISINIIENVFYWATDDSTLLLSTSIVEPYW